MPASHLRGLQDRVAAQVAKTKSGRSWGLANEQGCYVNCPLYLTRCDGQTAVDTRHGR